MFGLFCKKKVHLSRADFITLILSFQQGMLTVLSREAKKLFQPKIDAQILQYECEVLSLCMLSIAIKLVIQDNYLDLRKTIYVEYCRYRNYDNDTTKRFLGYSDMRCKRYYDAFNEYAQEHEAGGFFLGGVVANGLKGGENDKLELDIMKVVAAFSLFINSFKSTLEFIGDLKKKYDLSEVSSVFVK